ncbi:hypothetical protein CR195_027980 (plasmid) [Bacillus cereus]|nr:hypothetical protein CR195_027980 [Bacillus cereus]
MKYPQNENFLALQLVIWKSHLFLVLGVFIFLKLMGMYGDPYYVVLFSRTNFFYNIQRNI